MNHPSSRCVFKAKAGLMDQGNGFLWVHSSPGFKQCLQVGAFDEFESDEMKPLILSRSEYPSDIFMVQFRRAFGFLVKSPKRFLIV
jgi:hypothetical protein